MVGSMYASSHREMHLLRYRQLNTIGLPLLAAGGTLR
jgi:hypothetical protein